MKYISWSSAGWLGEAKVLCILHHWGVQLILTCSWARPAILAAGKGRGGMFLFLLFLHCHSFSFLLNPSLSSLLLSLFSLSLGDDTKWPTRIDVSLNPNTINSQSSDFLKFFRLGQFLSNYWSYNDIWHLWSVCLGQFLSNYCSYSQWYLPHAYILAWPLKYSHPYLTLTSISQSIRHATLSLLLI